MIPDLPDKAVPQSPPATTQPAPTTPPYVWPSDKPKSWTELPDRLRIPPHIIDKIIRDEALKRLLKELPSEKPSNYVLEEMWKKYDKYLSPEIKDYKVKVDPEPFAFIQDRKALRRTTKRLFAEPVGSYPLPLHFREDR